MAAVPPPGVSPVANVPARLRSALQQSSKPMAGCGITENPPARLYMGSKTRRYWFTSAAVSHRRASPDLRTSTIMGLPRRGRRQSLQSGSSCLSYAENRIMTTRESGSYQAPAFQIRLVSSDLLPSCQICPHHSGRQLFQCRRRMTAPTPCMFPRITR